MASLTAHLTCLAKRLSQASQWITVAESCTGGELSAAMTQLPGSSHWFDCGFITYTNQAKQHLLGVDSQTLQQHGAVSKFVAIEMAQGALARSQAHIAIAVTGIAGPTGGTLVTPVGCVWFAWTGHGLPLRTECKQFIGDRATIRQQIVCYAVQTVLDWMES